MLFVIVFQVVLEYVDIYVVVFEFGVGLIIVLCLCVDYVYIGFVVQICVNVGLKVM